MSDEDRGAGGPPEREEAEEAPPAGAKSARKAAKKAAKEQKRLHRAGDADPALGRKPCTLCGRACDLLVRCQADASGRWHMACGRCWMRASGGKVDGTAEAPHYRYGGLWKNHHAVTSGKRRVSKRSAPGGGGGGTDHASQHPPQQNTGAGASSSAAAAAAPGAASDQGAGPSDLEWMLLEEAAACEDQDQP